MNETSKVLVALDVGDDPTADWLEANGQLASAMLVRGHNAPGETAVYLWRLSQAENGGYDTYDSCVVAARCEADAKKIHPNGLANAEWWRESESDGWGDWASHLDNVTAVQLGMTLTEAPGSIVCSSYNAG